MEAGKEMQFVLTRRATLWGLVMALAAGLAAPPASARGWLPGLIGIPIVRGTVTALDAAAGTLEVTNRDGLSIELTTNTETEIRRDGRSATLGDLRVNDEVFVFYDRATRVARRIEAASPPPVELTGTITALDAAGGTVQITTDHGTQITLTTNGDTRVRLNRANTTLGNLALGQRVQATYRPENKVALSLAATTPSPDVVSGAITAIDPTAGTLQITPVAGAPVSLTLSGETEFRLNGRRVAPSAVVVGLLALVQTRPAGAARVVAAQTPPLVELAGTISALDVQGGTIQVTTAAMTTITLRLTAQTVVRRNNAASTVEQLAIGDRVVVRYEYLLLPNQSRALRIVATAAAPTPPPTGATAALTAVAVDPASVVGGAASTGTVTLSAAAPAGGATVNLTSNATTAATVPASVVVPAGATSATFPVTTNAVAAATPVTVTASLGAATATATLTVNPATTPALTGPTVTAVAVNPVSVDGGAASTGTVTLSAAAPAGGATVTLTSSDAAAAVPANVVVPEGATTATFAVTTNAVATATPVTISASLCGATVTVTLTVNPPATPPPAP
jgi:hypothetical protein